MIGEIIIWVLFIISIILCVADSDWSLLVIIFVIFIGTLFFAAYYPCDQNYYIEIVSLDRGAGVYGSFMLGSGTVDSYPVYYAYTKTDDGGYKIFEMSDVVLYERADTPRYEIETVCNQEYSFFNWAADCTTYKRLIVPKNTILKEFRA